MQKSLYVLGLFLCFSLASKAQLSTLGPAGATAGVNDYVYALETDTSADLLYVGGDFTTAGNVFTPFAAAWDGSNWSALGSGLNGTVRAMIMFEGDLYVGGDFTEAGGNTANRVARWDGTDWNAVGDGFDGGVRSFCIFNNELYAGGLFNNSGNNETKFIARWNGSAWEEVGGGLEATGIYDNYDGGVRTMTVMQNQLYVGGYFNEGNNGSESFEGNFLRWNGFSWQDISSSFRFTDNIVLDMAEREGILLVAGVGSPYIRSFDGVNWITGQISPLPLYTVNGDIFTLGYYDGFDIVGGGFQGVGINQIGNDVLYDEEYVHGIQNKEWYSFNQGVNNSVFCNKVFQDELYIGGAFTRMNDGFVQCNHIVRWKSELVVEAISEDAACNGVSDGSITLVPANGQAPYIYEWDDIGIGTESRTNLPSGVYGVTITDAIGRVEDRTVTVNNASQLTLNFDVTNTSGSNGQIDLTVTGGTMPYTYEWNTGATASSITGLVEANYSVEVEDAIGCVADGDADVDTLVNNSIAYANKIDWSLYPNPVTNTVQITSEQANGNYRLTIFNMVGKLVYQYDLIASGTSAVAVDLSTLVSGTYIASIANNQGAVVYREKLVKE